MPICHKFHINSVEILAINAHGFLQPHYLFVRHAPLQVHAAHAIVKGVMDNGIYYLPCGIHVRQ